MGYVKVWRRRPAVHAVTDAQPSLSDDIGRREKRYLIQMGIRTICLILAVVLDAGSPVCCDLEHIGLHLVYRDIVEADLDHRKRGSKAHSEQQQQRRNELHGESNGLAVRLVERGAWRQPREFDLALAKVFIERMAAVRFAALSRGNAQIVDITL